MTAASAATSPASAQAVLDARELVFGIAGAVRIGPVSLRLEPGHTYGIVGETGSGKSLLCRTIVGMLDITGGEIESGGLEYFGDDYAHADRRKWSQLRRTTVGYMPQASMAGLNPVRRIGSQLAELLKGSRAERRDQARTLMQQVQMRDPDRVLKSYPHELSGGMRQRVMLAFALIGDPKLLVADEPTTALDATVQAEVLNLIKTIQTERNMSVILVSHDMRVIRRMCDSVAVMFGGKVLEQGPTSEVLGTPSHPYTKALLLSDPALAKRKTMLGTVDGTAAAPVDWASMTATTPERTRS